MTFDQPWLSAQGDKTVLYLKVLPSSSRWELAGGARDEVGQYWLRLRITTAPEKGKANKAVIAYLSKTLRLPKSAFSIIAGEKERNKKLCIDEGIEILSACFDRVLQERSGP